MSESSEKTRRRRLTSDALIPWAKKYVSTPSDPEKEVLRRQGLQSAQKELAAKGLNIALPSLSSSFNALLINLKGKRGRRTAQAPKKHAQAPRIEPKKPLVEAEVSAKPPKIFKVESRTNSNGTLPISTYIEYGQPLPKSVVRPRPVYAVSPSWEEQRVNQTFLPYSYSDHGSDLRNSLKNIKKNRLEDLNYEGQLKEAHLRNLQLDKQIKKEKQEENLPSKDQSTSQTHNRHGKETTNVAPRVDFLPSFDILMNNPMFMPLFLGMTPEQKEHLIKSTLGLEMFRQIALMGSTSKQAFQDETFNNIGFISKPLSPEERGPAERAKMLPFFDERPVSDWGPRHWISPEPAPPPNYVGAVPKFVPSDNEKMLEHDWSRDPTIDKPPEASVVPSEADTRLEEEIDRLLWKVQWQEKTLHEMYIPAGLVSDWIFKFMEKNGQKIGEGKYQFNHEGFQVVLDGELVRTIPWLNCDIKGKHSYS